MPNNRTYRHQEGKHPSNQNMAFQFQDEVKFQGGYLLLSYAELNLKNN